MTGFFRNICSVVLMVWLSFVAHTAWATEFLPPEQAFVFNAQMKGTDAVQVSFTIAPNYYMYRDEFNFSVVSPDGSVVQNGAVKMPAAESKFDENFDKNMFIYHQNVKVSVPIKKTVEGDALFKIVVTSRGCANQGLCYPPRKTQAVLTATGGAAKVAANAPESAVQNGQKNEVQPINPASAISTVDETTNGEPALQEPMKTLSNSQVAGPDLATAKAAAMSLDNSAYARDLFTERNPLIALLLIFGLGLLLSLTPCMLPMIPVLSTMLAGQRDTSRGRGFLLALAYVTGMAVVYALIGIVAAKTGSGLYRYLQSPWVLGAFALILIVLALSLFDLFQLQLPAKWQQWVASKTQGNSGYVGAVVLGAASALIASPCVTAPLVGVVSYIVQSGNVGFGGLALFVLAYGMGAPLLLLGAGFGRLVPKSGQWMVRIKQLIGVLMIGAALWIAQPLWGKHWQAVFGSSQAAPVFQPITNSAELDAVIAQSDRPVMLDLYADWCRSCIEMEQKTFVDATVKKQMGQMNLVRVDMSNYTDDHAALLQRFSLYGPPAVIVLTPLSGQELLRVVGFEPADVFSGQLQSVLP